MEDNKIFFDNASTTKVDERVLEEMLPFFSDTYGNPSSLHSFGGEVAERFEKARSRVAALINAQPDEIFFTSCGTESNNIAIFGIPNSLSGRGNHIISSSVEHLSVLNPLKELRKQGFEITLLPVDKYGLVDPDELKKSIKKDTILISIMHANNEIGTIQRLQDLSKIASESEVVFHSDGIATAGIIPVDVKELGIDSYSFSAQQLYGPKGAAALYIKKGTRLKPIFLGGTQERGRRAGTENVPGIIGFGKACDIAAKELKQNIERIVPLRDSLIEGIKDKIEKARLNGHPDRRLPGNVHFSFEFVEGESILLMLDMEGIAAASGSSCASQALKSSHVLVEIGLKPTMAQGSILFSLGKYNEKKEVKKLLNVLPPIISKLREMSPLFKND